MPKSTKKKQNKRQKAKYPALDRSLNLKTRRYYIEADYVDGVYDADGTQVIRALTDEEKEWLNKFYEETVVTKFNKDGEDFYYDDDETRKALYRENNSRNKCLFNCKQTQGLLKFMNEQKYDRMWSRDVESIDYEEYLLRQIFPEEYEDDE